MIWVIEQQEDGTFFCVLSVKWFFSLPVLSTVYYCGRCQSSQGHGVHWLGCQVLPAVGAVSILVLAANSESSRTSQGNPTST